LKVFHAEDEISRVVGSDHARGITGKAELVGAGGDLEDFVVKDAGAADFEVIGEKTFDPQIRLSRLAGN
jgi:hypothetical protein